MSNGVEYHEQVSQGVDELISRLRNEGVDAGKTQAQHILERANKEAKVIVHQAKVQAKQTKREAKKEADGLLNGGQEALKTAMRDAVLAMKTALTDSFKADVRRLVVKELEQPDVLKALILEIAGTVATEARVAGDNDVEVMLPKHAVGLEELQNSPEKLENSPLTDLVYGLTRDMLIDGVRFGVSDEISQGIQVKLVDRDLVLDFTDQAIGTILLQHLQPRFRAILEGVLR